MFLSTLIFLVHLQAVLIPYALGVRSLKRFKYLENPYLIPIGFTMLGFASLSEMIDHAHTEWIYVNHSSIFNWLFYSFLSLGLSFLTIATIKDKLFIFLILSFCFSSISSYWFLGKSISLIFQTIISISLLYSWNRVFKDWMILGYPFFGIFLTTFFGVNLSQSGNQIWHIFIGPSGSISVLIFYIILKRSKLNKLI